MTTLFLCLSLLIAAVQFSTVDSALPCNSPLRRYLPDQFTHCASCSYGQWSSWTRFNPPKVIANQTCATGQASRYERSRTALPGSTCRPDPETRTKYECKQLQMAMYLEHWIIVCALPVFNFRCSNTEAESRTDNSSTSSWSRCWWRCTYWSTRSTRDSTSNNFIQTCNSAANFRQTWTTIYIQTRTASTILQLLPNCQPAS